MMEENIVLVMTAENDLERGIATTSLEDAGIGYALKDFGAGNLMRLVAGASIYGCQIYVNEEDYDQAKDVIISVLGEGVLNRN